MNIRPLFVVVFLSILALVVFFVFPREPETLMVKVKTISEESTGEAVHAEYPFFPELPKELNKKIENYVLEQINAFTLESEQNALARSEFGAEVFQSTLTLGWTPDRLTPKVISFVIRTELYTGGAHGRQTIATFSFDGEKEEEITLEAVFPGTPNYLERISQFALNDLKMSLLRASESEPNMDMLMTGTRPRKENFQYFTLGANNTITFYFPQYHVAPYVYGEQKVVMPISFVLTD
jgi:hypothetical protein